MRSSADRFESAAISTEPPKLHDRRKLRLCARSRQYTAIDYALYPYTHVEKHRHTGKRTNRNEEREKESVRDNVGVDKILCRIKERRTAKRERPRPIAKAEPADLVLH